MKIGEWLFFGALAYLVVFVFRRKNALEKIQANIGDIKELKFQSGFLTWIQEISIQNFDNVSFEISGANLDIFSNGQYVGKCGLRESQTITANGFSIISVTCVCTVTDLIQSLAVTIIDLFKKKAIDLKLSGVVSAYSVFSAPISTHVIIDPSLIFSVFKKI